MVNTPVLFDTNILIDYLNGIPEARRACSHYANRAISLITWMEVLAGSTGDDEEFIKSFLNQFRCIPIDETIAAASVLIRRNHKLKLPDAIIYASALLGERVLLTRNTRGFPAKMPSVRVPYKL